MLASSARFAASILESHDVMTLCNVIDPTGKFVVRTLDVISGSVSADASRKTRRQCSLVLQDPTGELVPDQVNDILQPYSGYHLQLYRGISWRDGTNELFPLGTFAPYAPKISDTGDSLEIRVDGYDRSKLISRIRWTQPYVIPSGTNTGTAIRAILADRMPGLRYSFEPTRTTVPATTLGTSADNDPWSEAVDMASADGLDLYFDARDIVKLRSIPDPELDPVVRTFDDGENSTVLSFTRENDASKMYTGVFVYSEGTEVIEPIRVEVWREDTTLRIPYFFPTALIRDENQARLTGESLLRRVGRAEFAADLSVIPDPRQEVGDVVRVRRARSKLDDTFVISSINMPLDATSEASITTERRRTAA
jgi:hypothetical protein